VWGLGEVASGTQTGENVILKETVSRRMGLAGRSVEGIRKELNAPAI